MKNLITKILKSKEYIIKYISFLIISCSLLTADCFSQTITWRRVLNNNYGNFNKAQQTYDGGYIAVGDERINNLYKIYIVKFDYLGNYLWTRIIGVGDTNGNWIEETSDKGFIIGGAQDSNGNTYAYLVKTDNNGNIQWSNTYSNSDLDQGYCVKQTTDGGYIFTCRTAPFRNGVMLIKTDSLGNIQVQKIYYSNAFTIYAYEILILNDGYLTIGSYSDNNNSDIYLMRFNKSLDTLWTKRIGGNNNDGGTSIDKINTGEYVIGGYSRSFNLNNKVESYISRIDLYGNIIWQRTYSHFGYDFCRSIRYKPGSGFIAVGTSDSLNNSVFKAKMRLIDMNGNLMYENSILPETAGAGFMSVELTNDNGFIAAGYAVLTGGFTKMFIVKTDSLLYSQPIGIINIGNNVPKTFKLYQNYPNPFNPTTKIEFDISGKSVAQTFLSVYDMLGREVSTLVNEQLKPGKYEVTFDASNYSSGVYFYKLVAGDFVVTKRMILLK